jgi:hypothetical protein
MSKLEAVLDGLCGTGVLLLTPVYLVYKFVIFAVS